MVRLGSLWFGLARFDSVRFRSVLCIKRVENTPVLHSRTENWSASPLCCSQAEDDVIRSGILEITDKQSVVLLSAIAMAMDLQEDAAPTDKQTLAMEVRGLLPNMLLILAFGR